MADKEETKQAFSKSKKRQDNSHIGLADNNTLVVLVLSSHRQHGKGVRHIESARNVLEARSAEGNLQTDLLRWHGIDNVYLLDCFGTVNTRRWLCALSRVDCVVQRSDPAPLLTFQPPVRPL